MSSKPRISHGIIGRIGVTLAIGDILQDRRYRLLCCRNWEPEAGTQNRAIGERNLDVIPDFDGKGKVRPNSWTRAFSHSDHPFAICCIRSTSRTIWIECAQPEIADPTAIFLPQCP